LVTHVEHQHMQLSPYLERIGHAGTLNPTLETLEAVVARHAAAIPFENIDAFLGRRVSLDPDAVFDKLVKRRRGGWCFEQNLLLGEALRQMGFDVTDLGARVVWGRTADAVAPRTHRALLVRAAGHAWLADVGFGGMTMAGLIDMDKEGPQQVARDTFRLSRAGEDFLVSASVRAEWLPMYRFDLHPQLPVDFEAANFQLVHDPDSHFTQGLVASRIVESGRHALRGRELAFHAFAGETTRRELPSAAELLATLRGELGIVIDAGTESALLARLESQDLS
jgi:N-hydroxyarylamine O-acetyltransferase